MSFFNANQYEPVAGGNEPWPEGWYTVVIVSADIPEGKTYVGFKLKCVDGPMKDKDVIDRHNIYHNDPETQHKARKRLSKLCHVLNVYDVAQPVNLFNIPFQVRVTIRETPEYGKQNNFPDYRYADGREFKAGGPAGAPTNQPQVGGQAPGGFGVPQGQAPQGFGAPQGGQPGGFGAPQGGQGFGAPQQPQGGQPQGFGAPQGGFGGQPPQQGGQGFGASQGGGFGGQAQPNGGGYPQQPQGGQPQGFGAPQGQAPGGFGGQAPQGQGFGQAPQGQGAPPNGFGQVPQGFGQPQGGGFGAPPPNWGNNGGQS